MMHLQDMITVIEKTDPPIAQAILSELNRQNQHIELIPSENFASLAVLMAQGSVLTNKYAEGLPGKRYYGGCQFVDIVESLAQERVKALFGAEHANVQPHSGASANFAVMLALLKPGDTILGMNLSHGGHLTHGSPVNYTGLYFKPEFYGVDPDTGYLDYEELQRKAEAVKPKLIIAGASAYSRHLYFDKFRKIADSVDALLMVDMAHIAGLIVADLHQNPVAHAHVVTSTTHKTLRGPRGGFILTPSQWAKKIDKAVFPGAQGGPLMHAIAAKAIAFKEAAQPEFKTYQQQIVKNAAVLAESLKEQGLKLVSNGTDNHLMLIDLRSLNLTGKKIEAALGEVNITVNKNTVPNDPNSPFVTSGIRIGTPAVTTRGMKEIEMCQLGQWIAQIIHQPDDDRLKEEVREAVGTLCQAFPVYY